MGKPIRHRDKWRIRWVDDHGVRQSEVHDDFRTAAFALRQYEVHVDEVARGLRAANVGAPRSAFAVERDGFNLHAGARIEAGDDLGRERLCGTAGLWTPAVRAVPTALAT